MKRFNTFEGVFIPCLLSILGVIMYLRLGWVVGHVGLTNALVIILLANLITLATALSMSSVVTNIRIGVGGAHSIISKSLGVEAGGAIGIPLYMSQALSIAFYITGFAECWISVFPQHNMLGVSLGAWFAILALSYLSAKLAFRLQYGIMALIILSVVSIWLGREQVQTTALTEYGLHWGEFWKAFAIFFPAVTGILAGATMSGELVDPKKSIPRGTLAAIAVSFVIYVALAAWLAFNVSADQLITNTAILIDVGRWRWLIIAGIMGATLSSALSMAVGSPRTLLALGRHSIIPFASSFSSINRRGEPTTAIMFTALLVLITLLFGTLDSVASLLTMIFLITYGMINLSVFIEQSLGIASFRPTFRIPRIISLVGGVGCIVTMFLINAQFSIIALGLIVIIYFLLIRQKIEINSPDVRSGLLLFLAEQLAKASTRLPYHPKIWKPNLLVPVKDDHELERTLPFIKAVVSPRGRIFLFKIKEGLPVIHPENLDFKKQEESETKGWITHIEPLKEEGLFIETSKLEAPNFYQGVVMTAQMVKSIIFPPNTLFYTLSNAEQEDADVLNMVRKTTQEGLGVILLLLHPKVGFSQEKVVNLWIRKQSPNIDLSILIALQLKNNWEGKVRIIQAVNTPAEVEDAQVYLNRLKTIMRLPADIEILTLVGDFRTVLSEAPPADINIFGMPDNPNVSMAREIFERIQTSLLFLRDSEHESAIA